MTGQKKSHSFIEVCINTAIGYFVALLTQIITFPWFDIEVTYKQQFLIGLIFTIVSIARGYFVRRLFNYLNIKNKPSKKAKEKQLHEDIESFANLYLRMKEERKKDRL
jgi:hypothetical protein